MMKFVLPALVVLVSSYTVSAWPLHCDTLCYPGTYCRVKECINCPDGHFMNKELHTETACWSHNKAPPPGSHSILTKNGTRYHDYEWDCEAGYKKVSDIGYPQDYECVEITTPQTPTLSYNTTLVPENNTRLTTGSLTKVTPTPLTGKDTSALNTGEIIGIVIGVLILLLVVVFLLIIFFTFKRKCFNGNRDTNEDPKKNNGHKTENRPDHNPLLQIGDPSNRNDTESKPEQKGTNCNSSDPSIQNEKTSLLQNGDLSTQNDPESKPEQIGSNRTGQDPSTPTEITSPKGNGDPSNQNDPESKPEQIGSNRTGPDPSTPTEITSPKGNGDPSNQNNPESKPEQIGSNRTRPDPSTPTEITSPKGNGDPSNQNNPESNTPDPTLGLKLCMNRQDMAHEWSHWFGESEDPLENINILRNKSKQYDQFKDNGWEHEILHFKEFLHLQRTKRNYYALIQKIWKLATPEDLLHLFKMCNLIEFDPPEASKDKIDFYVIILHEATCKNPDTDILVNFVKIGMAEIPWCFESRELKNILRSLWGQSEKTFHLVKGEITDQNSAHKLFNCIIKNIEARESFLTQLKVEENLKKRLEMTNLIEKEKRKNDDAHYAYIECGKKWFLCRPGRNHLADIHVCLKELEENELLGDQEFLKLCSECCWDSGIDVEQTEVKRLF